jgi:hypothetical protein
MYLMITGIKLLSLLWLFKKQKRSSYKKYRKIKGQRIGIKMNEKPRPGVPGLFAGGAMDLTGKVKDRSSSLWA